MRSGSGPTSLCRALNPICRTHRRAFVAVYWCFRSITRASPMIDHTARTSAACVIKPVSLQIRMGLGGYSIGATFRAVRLELLSISSRSVGISPQGAASCSPMRRIVKLSNVACMHHGHFSSRLTLTSTWEISYPSHSTNIGMH